MNWSDLLQTHGYWLLAIGCLLEGETVLVLAGFAAHRGLLDPLSVVGVAATAGFVGDQIFFWLGRRHGAKIVQRWPSIAAQSERVNRLIEHWHEGLIVGVRFAYGLRIAGPILIGMSAVSPGRFAVFNAIGALLWAVIVGGVGWFFGAAAEALLGEIQHIEGVLLGGLAVAAVVFWFARRWWQQRQARSAPTRRP